MCATLASLHSRRITHRCLTPDTIVIPDRDMFVLRDLGLATHDATPGEGPEGYQAPEQSKRGYHGADGVTGSPRGRIRPGPTTDVYQIAVIAYHLITGHLPDRSTLLPARALAPGLSEKASRALDAALAPSPGDRLGIRAFSNAL